MLAPRTMACPVGGGACTDVDVGRVLMESPWWGDLKVGCTEAWFATCRWVRVPACSHSGSGGLTSGHTSSFPQEGISRRKLVGWCIARSDGVGDVAGARVVR